MSLSVTGLLEAIELDKTRAFHAFWSASVSALVLSLLTLGPSAVYMLYTADLKYKLQEQGLELGPRHWECPHCCAVTSVPFLLMHVSVCMLFCSLLFLTAACFVSAKWASFLEAWTASSLDAGFAVSLVIRALSWGVESFSWPAAGLSRLLILDTKLKTRTCGLGWKKKVVSFSFGVCWAVPGVQLKVEGRTPKLPTTQVKQCPAPCGEGTCPAL